MKKHWLLIFALIASDAFASSTYLSKRSLKYRYNAMWVALEQNPLECIMTTADATSTRFGWGWMFPFFGYAKSGSLDNSGSQLVLKFDSKDTTARITTSADGNSVVSMEYEEQTASPAQVIKGTILGKPEVGPNPIVHPTKTIVCKQIPEK